MINWAETEDGKKYCSEACYKKSWHKCMVCNKPMKECMETKDGKRYCTEKCFINACPVCSVCGKHTESWIESDKGEIFCSHECRNNALPNCGVCGKTMDSWLVSDDNIKYCSEECYAHVLPKCMHCGKVMKEWLITDDGRVYCSNGCISESNIIMQKVNTLCSMTGLSISDVNSALVKNSWGLDEAIIYIDNYMQSLDGKVVASKVVIDGIKNAGIYEKLDKGLSSYNTMRGGSGGFKGFVFEDLHAANASLKGQFTEVIANNGPADFLIRNSDGTYSYAKAKLGYNLSNIDWAPYKGQSIVIDKGNTKLIESAKKAGMNVIESDISSAEAQRLAKAMQLESKLTGKPNAPIISNIHSYHQAGINSAKSRAAFGAGFSIGSNIVDLVAVTVGAIVTAVASGAAAAVGGAIASATVGAAVTGCVATAIATLEATAVGATMIATAPLVAAGAVIGGVFKIGKKFLGRR